MFKRILLGFIVIVGGFLAFAASRPDSYKVERSAKIDAPAPLVYGQLEDFKSWAAWSPWDKLDPAMKKTYEGPAKGMGAEYSWQGNDKVGKGKMTIVEATPPTAIKYRLEFMEPFAAVADTRFTLAPAGDQAVNLTWAMEGENSMMGKVMSLFMDMDKQIGSDFEKGLAGLKTISEAEAQKLAAAAAEAAAKAEAEAAAAKAKAEAEAAAAAEADAAKGKGKGKGKG